MFSAAQTQNYSPRWLTKRKIDENGEIGPVVKVVFQHLPNTAGKHLKRNFPVQLKPLYSVNDIKALKIASTVQLASDIAVLSLRKIAKCQFCGKFINVWQEFCHKTEGSVLSLIKINILVKQKIHGHKRFLTAKFIGRDVPVPKTISEDEKNRTAENAKKVFFALKKILDSCDGCIAEFLIDKMKAEAEEKIKKLTSDFEEYNRQRERQLRILELLAIHGKYNRSKFRPENC